MRKMIKVISFIIVLFVSNVIVAQENQIVKYDFLEVIVIQKANKRGKVKKIEIQEDQIALKNSSIVIKDVEDLKQTSDMLMYMNQANWEYVDRRAIITEDNDPVWMSYIFRKRR